jgi:prepilin-type processing-associated H-X9-DG protein
VRINYPRPTTPRTDNSPEWAAYEASFGSRHAGQGANFVFADGSVRFLRDGIDQRVLSAIGTRASGEVVAEID